MKQNQQLLSALLRTIQLGQVEIRSVLDTCLGTSLRNELECQLREYDSIEQEAHGIALSRGWVLKELDPAIKGMTNMMTLSRLSFGNIDSKAAAMMIQGNTRGIIKGFKNLNQYPPSDQRITNLAHKLIDFEENNNRQLQGFL